MRPGRIVMLVLGTLSALLGLGLLAGSGAVGWANYQQRDNGFFTTPVERFAANSFALTSPRLDIMTESSFPETAPVVRAGQHPAPWLGGRSDQGDLHRDRPAGRRGGLPGRCQPLRNRRRQILAVPGRCTVMWPVPRCRHRLRTRDSGLRWPPGREPRSSEWDLRPGSWAVVIMNADASAPVAVDLQAGARSDLLWPVFIGLLVGGIVLLLIGVPLIVFGAAGLGRGKGGPPAGPGQPAQPYAGQPVPGSRPTPLSRTRRPPAGAPPGAAPGALPGIPPGAGVVYPARLSGYLDPDLSRWKWLVKWFLAIPHFIVLFFLWFAFGVVTIVAWFAILFTGHYPRSLFNFNVGVIRWSWRVAFYCLRGARHRPLPALHPGAHRLPGRLRRRLSRAALPRAGAGEVLAAGHPAPADHRRCSPARPGPGCTATASGSQVGAGMSLFGLLVFIAGVILLFTGRVLPGAVRLPDGPEPLDLPRHRLRRADAGRISAVPSGHGPPGSRGSRGDSARHDSCRPRVCAPARRTRR